MKKTMSVFLIVFSCSMWLASFIFLFNIFYPQNYQEIIKNCAKKYDLSKALIASVINVESGYDKNAVSKAGAVGLMQVLPTTANWLKNEKIDLFDPETNIDVGCEYLKMLYDKFENLTCALCAYNAGPSNVQMWLKSEKCSKDGKTLFYIPFRETREYTEKILKQEKIYAFLMK